MRRRDFVAGLGAMGWPLAARGQQPPMPVIGLLQMGSPSSRDFTGFRQGLKEAGYVEGQHLAIDVRWANNDEDRLPGLAADLVRRRVRVIVAFGSIAAVRAVKAVTTTIPIVFGFGLDPVELGLVASLNRPGGNITGMTSLSSELVGKQLGMLHELLPQASHFGLLSNPGPIHERRVKDAQAAASSIGVTIEILSASTRGEIENVFGRIATDKRVQGLVVSDNPFFGGAARAQLAILAARFTVPAIYPFRTQAEAGGLMSYGPDLVDHDREVGHYVGRILKGERPADLPVQQVSKFQLVINLKTAKALGLTIPETLLATADEVIQ